MRKCRLPSLVVASLLLLPAGCTIQPTEGDPPTALSSKEPLVRAPGLSLGQGFNRLTQSPAPSTCIEHAATSLELLDHRKSHAFYVYSQSDLVDKLKLTMSLNVKASDVAASAAQTFTQYYSSNVNSVIFVMTAEVDSIRRKVTKVPPTGSPTAWCSPSNPARPSTMGSFLQDCGDEYLTTEDLGGVILLSADVTNMSTSQRRSLEITMNLDARGAVDAGVNGSVETAADAGFGSLEFTVDVTGLPAPSADLLNANGKLELGQVTAYLNQIQQPYTDAYNKGTVNSSAYGVVLDQQFLPYTAADVNYCTSTTDVTDPEWACYENFATSFEQLTWDDSEIARKKDEYQYFYDHQGLFIFPQTSGDHNLIQDYAGVIDTFNFCRTQMPSLMSTCYNSVLESAATTCGSCVTPPECEPTTWSNRASQLPIPAENSPSTPPNSPAVRNWVYQVDDHKDLSQISNSICFLNGLGGRFEGGGEFAGLRTVGGFWRGFASSLQTSDDYELHSVFVCVDRANFFTNSTTVAWTSDVFANAIASGSGVIAANTIAPGYQASALSGVSGKFIGFPVLDKALIGQGGGAQNSVSVVNAFASDSYVAADGFGFGLYPDAAHQWDAPVFATANGVTEFVANSTGGYVDGRGEAMMADVDKSVCYLTEVRGELRDSSDAVFISERDGRYLLTVESGCEPSLGIFCGRRRSLEARARCYAFDQTR